MGSIKGFIDWVKGEDVEDEYEDEMPRQRNEEPSAMGSASSYDRAYDRSYDRSYESAPAEPSSTRRGNKVVNINTTTQLAVVLVKPDRFENAAEIADHLKDKRTVVLNLEQTNKDIARPSGGLSEWRCICQRRQDQKGCQQHLHHYTL